LGSRGVKHEIDAVTMSHNDDFRIRRDIHLVAHVARRIQRLRRRVVDVIDHVDWCGLILFDDQRRFVLGQSRDRAEQHRQ